MSVGINALQFFAHHKFHSHGVKCKYTGEDYIVHCEEMIAFLEGFVSVRALPAAVFDGIKRIIYAHDLVEDTTVRFEDLRTFLYEDELTDVIALTDPESSSSRYIRKQDGVRRLANASWRAQLVKCADIWSNARSINQHDFTFAEIYNSECLEILHAMKVVDQDF